MAKDTGEKTFKWIGLIMFVVGLGVFLYTVKLGIETSRQAKWPTVEGSIAKADFEEVVIKRHNEMSQKRPGRDEIIWKPHFEYGYEVNGQKFVSQQISTFDPTCDTENQMQDLRRLISKNQTVVVYYNPENPGFSVINPFPNLITTWVFSIGSVLVGFLGLGILWVCRDA